MTPKELLETLDIKEVSEITINGESVYGFNDHKDLYISKYSFETHEDLTHKGMLGMFYFSVCEKCNGIGITKTGKDRKLCSQCQGAGSFGKASNVKALSVKDRKAFDLAIKNLMK